jgi:hypothetical protein
LATNLTVFASPRLSKRLRLEPLEPRLMLAADTLAASGFLDLIQGDDDPVAQITAALVDPGSGINVVFDSARYVGRVGDGADPNTAQSAIFSGLVLKPSDATKPTISFPKKGVLLTSGVANLPSSNTQTEFDSGSLGIEPPGLSSPNDVSDLSAILVAADAPDSDVRDLNVFEFQFTVAKGISSLEADFVYGSDEFPNQSVTDIFAFIVDGKNYAFFQDKSLISFVRGRNDSNFNDNDTSHIYPIEYDGISNLLHVVGLLDPTIATGGSHTLKIAIANTSDDRFDSGVFIGDLLAGTSNNGGIGERGRQVRVDPMIGPGLPPQIVEMPTVPIFPNPGLALLLYPAVVPIVPPDQTVHGSDGYIDGRTFAKTSPSFDALASHRAELIDSVLAIDKVEDKLALASFLDFVDPELVSIELGDEPPTKLAPDHRNDVTAASTVGNQPITDGAQVGKSNLADDSAATHGGDTSQSVTYMKPVAATAQTADESKGHLLALQTFVSNYWRLLLGITGTLLVGGALWKGRPIWQRTARRVRLH